MFCTIKNVAKEFKDGLMTGTRLLSIHCRENDIHKIPYCESKRSDGAGVGPGRPPKCFRCNEIGHIRGECPNTIAGVGRHAYLRSYSNAVTGANTTPLGEWRGPVDRDETNSGESPDPSPKRLFSLFSLEGAIDNSGFLPTRAPREETEDDLFAL